MWSKQKREIRLIDFGSSGIIRAGKLFAHPCGSLAYLAPELVQGKGYSENVDVWALGVTFYALLTGRFPFGGGSKTADRPLNVLQRIACQCLYIPDHVCTQRLPLCQPWAHYAQEHSFSCQRR